MSALALSVLLSFVSAVAYAGGAIVQERVAVTTPGKRYAPLRRAAWWAAVALNGLGGLLHVVALAYGPLSLVQPLGALTIVFALPMAALFVGRRAGAAAWRGAIMTTVGLAGLLSLVGASPAQSLSGAQRVALAVITGGALAALTVAGRAAHRHPAVRSVLLAVGAGLAFGMSSVFTKTVAVDWTDGVAAAELPSLAAIGALATAGMLLSQASYRGGGLTAPLATLTVVNPVAAAAVGITMFGEGFRYGTTGTLLALGCGVVAVGGLILLTTERMGRTTRPVRTGAAGASGDAGTVGSAGAAGAGRAAGAVEVAGAVGVAGKDAPDRTGTAGGAGAGRFDEPASAAAAAAGEVRAGAGPAQEPVRADVPAGAAAVAAPTSAAPTSMPGRAALADLPVGAVLGGGIPAQLGTPVDGGGPGPARPAAEDAGQGAGPEEHGEPSPSPASLLGEALRAVPFRMVAYVPPPTTDRHRPRVSS
ncbi:DMT family transporter [Streptomyces sennicomposti]|uniref:DMT family transporter n=1 Tax=Streptomyces sennicomposti TaxID=2873384 RepID=UPI001CA638D8|nr:DMT family transporter [Streptomyces sennicomposti]MBY8868491.1 DMT family transporter [Streptomyces sennicomposti]